MAFAPYDDSDEEFDMFEYISYRYLPPREFDGSPIIDCSATEFVDQMPDVDKVCFCFVKDSEYLEMVHLENMADEVGFKLESLTKFVSQLGDITKIDFSIGYVDLIAKMEVDSYIFIDIAEAFDNIAETYHIDDGMNAHEFAYEYTNFFTNEAIQTQPISSMV